MKVSLALFLSMLFLLPSPAVAECMEATCVDVYTKDNEIIIEARKKGSSTGRKKVVDPKPSPTPTLWFPPKPSPRPKIKSSHKPHTFKVRVERRTANLSDRLTKLVPTGGVAFQPEFEALLNVPVIFWIDLPQIFQSRVNIIGEVVDVALRPGFIWSFGDGQILATAETGSPYPNHSIAHSYSAPGTYMVVVLTTWNGTFTHNGAVRAISGKIIKTSVATVTVVSAPTRFTK